MARIIVITSGKGGAGKTMVTANLGRALARKNQRVVLMDVDIGLNNLDVVLGIENKVVYDLVDCIEGRCRIKQTLITDTEEERLSILPSIHSYDKSRITSFNIKNVASMLSSQFDFVLIDCPAGIELGFHRAVASASEALVVVTPHISSIRDADKVINLLQSYDMQSINIVVNRVRGDLILSGEMVSVEDIKTVINADAIGVIPEDDEISIMSALTRAHKGCGAYKAFDYLAENLINNEKNIYDPTAKFKGLFGKIKMNLRRNV